ncbi:MAG TPA: HAD family hydrolase [Intrasporangiaceae bacterium]|nr:HAD family hydrolase [Intrasporangiaceae bacterium]
MPERGPTRPQLIATDLDGTFLRSDGTVSDRTVRAWAALPEQGIETVLVTARPPRWLHDLAHVVGRHGIALCGNGAFVYAVESRQIIETHAFDPDLLADLIADLRAAVPSVQFATETAAGPFFEDGWPGSYFETAITYTPRGQTPPLLQAPVGKLLALAPRIPTEEFLATVEEVVAGRGEFAYSGALGLAEIGAVAVTKAAALERWADEHGIAAEQVWAFGDMPNDLPMIEWAGLGVAVANAHPTVLEVADLIAPSNDEDGVAATVEPLLGT